MVTKEQVPVYQVYFWENTVHLETGMDEMSILMYFRWTKWQKRVTDLIYYPFIITYKKWICKQTQQ